MSNTSKTSIRLRTTVFAAADYVVNVLILFAYALVGTISFSVPVKVMAVAIVFNVIFLGGIGSGLTQRFRDPSITGYQVLAACGLNLLGLVLAPQVAYMFLVNLFVPLAYAVLHFSRREFLFAWLLLSLVLGGVIRTIGDAAGIALSSRAEQAIFWAVMMLALGRFLAINAEVSRLRARLHAKNKDLATATAKLAELATHDELTGIWNRRKFMDMLQEERQRAERTGSRFCVAIVDADHFKQVNDRFGHAIGDAVLQELAKLLQQTMRTTDRIARFGGEEFALLLVDFRPDALFTVMERVRARVHQHDWGRIAPGLAVTISTGAAVWRPSEETTQTFERADIALYEAKHAGRNCFRIAQN